MPGASPNSRNPQPTSTQLSPTARFSRAGVPRLLLALAVAIITLPIIGGMILIVEGRMETRRLAARTSENVAAALERDIRRSVTELDAVLRHASDAAGQSSLAQLPPALRQVAVFGRLPVTGDVEAIVVTDARGAVLAAAGPAAAALAVPASTLRIHRDLPDLGLFTAMPKTVAAAGALPGVIVSRRRDGAVGTFGGVVLCQLGANFFQRSFERLELGKHGAAALYRMDGQLLAGKDHDAAMGDRLIRVAEKGNATVVVAADGRRRLLTVRQLGALPLLIGVVAAEADSIAGWRSHAGTIFALLCSLSLAAGILTLGFRREILRRLAAEDAITERAQWLSRLAATDELTGLANRRAFDDAFGRAWRQSARNATPIALLMIDVDHFKQFNDQYGHSAGDDALRRVSQSIGGQLRRPLDCGARYGGEEFAVVLPETGIEGALIVAEGIRRAVASAGVPHSASVTGRLTVSIGIAAVDPAGRGAQPDYLLHQADLALYQAKQGGRNRVQQAEHAACRIHFPGRQAVGIAA